MNMLSREESKMIVDGVRLGVRCDGRSPASHRTIVLDANVLPQSSGSARVCISDTDVLVGVTLNMVDVDPTKPDLGFFDLNVSFGPGHHDDSETCGRVASILRNIMGGVMVDLRRGLCVHNGFRAWKVSVDAIITSPAGGNLLGAVSIAMLAALRSTRIPKVDVTEGDEGTVEIDISNNLKDSAAFDCSNLPLVVELAKIGGVFVVDTTSEEEMAGVGSLVCGVLGGKVVGIQKSGSAFFDPSSLVTITSLATSAENVLLPAVIGAVDRALRQQGAACSGDDHVPSFSSHNAILPPVVEE